MMSSVSTAVDGRVRVIIESVKPSVDEGLFPVKRVVGDTVTVEADCFTDGHDQLICLLQYRIAADKAWRSVEMKPLGNDRWRAAFEVEQLGRYTYNVIAWVDALRSWRHDFARRVDADDLRLAARIGADLIEQAAARAAASDKTQLAAWAARLRAEKDPLALAAIARDNDQIAMADKYADRTFASRSLADYHVTVDRLRARYSAWYELFPRSTAAIEGRHGTFRDCEARLPYIAAMGFDVLYMPPIHPIGRVRRKGVNNTLEASDTDVGSPWAIGSTEGGHTALHPQLGSMQDFRSLVARAKDHGLELALDIAFQCAPDHPWVASHPQWFRWRPDGTVQYAENPPKKYQDIYPFNFETDDWQALWQALADVFLFWIAEGVKIFRVDNPHTKSFPFWHWAIPKIKAAHPDVIFLAEAFTRPRVMHRLAKLGFSQSYTYFTWRNTKQELTEYFTELAQSPSREYFRPNCWPNTPDILHESFNPGNRATFMTRVVLAATLSANYGLYGPAYELLEHEPREHGSEEYLHSEKYQLRHWNLGRPDSLAPFITRVNRARRENPALHEDWHLRFFQVDNPQLICYAKTTADRSNAVVMVVNLDPYNVQSGWIGLDLAALGIEASMPYQMHDLLTDARYTWHGAWNFVQLDPSHAPAHIFRVRRRTRTEHSFDYFE